ncbi:hypothetical protein [Sutcliffiella rhizosphaerae]|uniref:Uncharacterized protein n=1 Tax=Sutcliffiella rhizosphaerae TaxID=2880967 RepID=A0ABM8YN19_9BACI|nr:hypothetical protein [Sutcliffiella rhizosphaerae]CAG9621315.1 hypothetical protein BACCIP111883_02087 [Sutcliffiella rhizosphaerae]
MNNNLHEELRDFPKDYKMKRESVQRIAKKIEVEESKREQNKRSRINMKLAMAILGIFFACFSFLYIVMYDEENVQNFAANLSGKSFMSTPKVTPKNIIITSESHSQYKWAFSPKIPHNLLTEEKTSIVGVKILSKGEAEILPATEDFYTFDPFTPIEVEIMETIYGNTLGGTMTIYQDGGEISITNFMANPTNQQRAEKMELTRLSKEEQDTTYLSFTSEHDYRLQIGKEYALILTLQTEGIHTIMVNGYGIFKIGETESGERIYTNVLTGFESSLQFE